MQNVKTKNGLIGFYNEYGYHIDRIVNGRIEGDPLYRAGNSRFDSAQSCYTLEPDQVVDLDALKEYCEGTGKEIAKEHNLTFLGVEYDESEAEAIKDLNL